MFILIAVLTLSGVCLAVPTQLRDRPVKITDSPRVSVPGCGRSPSSGKTVLSVTLDKSGEVTQVQTLRLSGCGPFDKEALRVARKIKFKPALRNGLSITVTKTFEYEFSVY